MPDKYNISVEEYLALIETGTVDRDIIRSVDMEEVIAYSMDSIMKRIAFNNADEFRTYVLNPKLVGEIQTLTRMDDDSYYPMGISYHTVRRKNSQEKSIEGTVLTMTGISFLKGIESNIEGFKGIQFDTYGVNPLGMISLKDKGLAWECSTPEKDSNYYEGMIREEDKPFKLYPNDGARPFNYADYSAYYDIYVRRNYSKK